MDNKYQDMSIENIDVTLCHNFEPKSLIDENTNRLDDFLNNYGAKYPSKSTRRTISILSSDDLIVYLTTDEPVDEKRLQTVEAQVADTSQKKCKECNRMGYKTTYMCSYPNCYRIYLTISAVIQHGMGDHNGRYGAKSWYQVIKQCNYCHLRFLSEFDIYKHIMLIHNANDDPLVEKRKERMLRSPPISKQFHQKIGCLTDKNRYVKSKDKQVPCKFCNKTFRNALSLGQHVLGYHVIPNEIIKPIKSADEIFKDINKQGLVDPADSHNEVQRQVQLFESDSVLEIVEPEELIDVSDGDNVIRIVGSNFKNVNKERIFECDICGRAFTEKRYLKVHKQRGHTVRVKKKITFECDVCNKSLIGKRSLMAHQQRHIKTTYECDVCGQSFDRKISLIGHVRRHSHKLDVKATFECDVCGKSLTCKRNLTIHRQRHIDKQYMCEYCGKTFHFETDLSKHLCQPFNNNKRFKCAHCGKWLSSKVNMAKHLQLHSNVKPFPCGQCKLSFTYRSSWKAHQLMHEPILTQKCHLCPKAFRYKYSLDLHLMRLHNPNGRIFKCDQCDKAFYTKPNLISHTIVHVNERPYLCSVCSSTFKKKSYLNIHIRRYHNDLEKHMRRHSQRIRLLNRSKKIVRKLPIFQPGVHENLRTAVQGKCAWKCDHCEYYSHFRHRFVDHYRMHTGEKPYTCTICGKCFRFKTNLLQHKYSQFHNHGTSLKCDACGDHFHKIKYKLMHVNRVHNSSNGSLECDMCGECLPDKNSLIDHIQSHAGGKPHMCSKCGASFIYSSSLKFHQLLHRVHNCHICSKLLRSKQTLNFHLQRHTGDLNFKCDQCDKAFHSCSHLALHKFVHSDVRPFKCTKCGVVLKYKKNWERHEKSHK